MTRAWVQTIVLTPDGKAYAARVHGAKAMRGWIVLLSVSDTPGRLASADDLLKESGGDPGVVALPDATSTATPGKVGIWTDRAHRFRVSFGLAGGAQLFYEQDLASRVLTTNVDQELSDLARRVWWPEEWSQSTDE